MPPPGLEYLTSNRHTAFPFKEDALGLVRSNGVAAHGTSATLPLDFLVDAVIYLPPDLQSQYPVAYLYNIIKTPTAWIIRITGPGGVVTLCDIVCAPGGSNIISLQEPDTTRVTARLLKGPGFDTYLAAVVEDSFSNTLPFEDCVIEPRPYKLDSFIVCDSAGIPKSAQITGDVVLHCGYNVNMLAVESAEHDGTDITLEVVPTVGEGVAPASEAPTPAARNKAPMGLIPDQMGGVRIVTDDCYEVVPLPPDPSKPTELHFQIQGNCYACCTCEQYVAVAKALKRLIARASTLENAILKGISSLAHRYTDLVNQYNTEYYPVHRKVYVTAKAICGVNPQTSTQDVRFFAGRQITSVAVRVTNRCDKQVWNMRVKVDPRAAVGAVVHNLSASCTKGKLTTYSPLFHSKEIAQALSVDCLYCNEGVSASWYFTTRDTSKPVTKVIITVTYTREKLGPVYTERLELVPETPT